MTTEPDRLGAAVVEQGLIPGVAPVSQTARDIARLERDRAWRRGWAPLPEGGLFDEVGKQQQDMF